MGGLASEEMGRRSFFREVGLCFTDRQYFELSVVANRATRSSRGVDECFGDFARFQKGSETLPRLPSASHSPRHSYRFCSR